MLRPQSWHGTSATATAQQRTPPAAESAQRVGAPPAPTCAQQRGIAIADFWNRGRLDIAVAASTDRHALLRNEIDDRQSDNRHGWLEVELVGTRSNRDAVGTRVTASAGNLRLTREVALGDGYGSQSTLRLHFGLGRAQSVDELAVRWPRSGIVQRFRHVAGQRIVEVTEGRDALVEKRYGALGG